MKKEVSSVLLNLGKFRNLKFLRKNIVFKNLQTLTNCLWTEFIPGNNRKKNSNRKRIKDSLIGSNKLDYFLNFVQKKEKTLKTSIETDTHRFYREEQNFLVISLDEYINGRKKGVIFNLHHLDWEKKGWKNLEKMFEAFLLFLEYRSETLTILFFLLESVRYDKILKIFKKKEEEKELVLFLKNSNFFYYSRNQRIFLGFLLGFFPFQFSQNSKKKLGFELRNFFLKKDLGNFFQGKEITIKKFLKIGKFLFYRSSTGILRGIFDFFSKLGIANFNVFWVLKSSRSFNNLFSKMALGNVEREIFQFERDLFQKKFPGEIPKKNQSWQYRIKKNKNCTLAKSAFVFGTGLINMGTNKYSFIYEILIELEKIQIWTKFLVGSSFSLVNFGSHNFYKNFSLLLENEIISDYLKGGILFGMGLNLNGFWEGEKFFIDKCKLILKEKSPSVVKYGACLGLALNGRKTLKKPKKSQTYHLLKSLITSDSLSGEGATIAIGLLFTGTSSSILLEDIILLIQEIEHQKIGKTLSFSLAMIFLGQKDDSEKVFEKLILEKDPSIREGAIFIYSLAFVGTGNILVTKKLLKVLSIDPDDNVKKAVLIGLGFIFFSKYESIENIFLQLSQHYNPFVRYGVCFGLFLSSFKLPCIEKVELILEKLSNDKIDFVRQGAYICLGLTFLGSYSSGRKKKTNLIFQKALERNTENSISKFGAYIGSSIMDLREKIKSNQIRSEKYFFSLILGLFLFIQYWSWIPNLFFINILISF